MNPAGGKSVFIKQQANAYHSARNFISLYKSALYSIEEATEAQRE